MVSVKTWQGRAHVCKSFSSCIAQTCARTVGRSCLGRRKGTLLKGPRPPVPPTRGFAHRSRSGHSRQTLTGNCDRLMMKVSNWATRAL